MVQYNPRDWFGLIFKFHKSDTFRQLAGMMVLIALFAWLIAYFEIEVLKMQFKTTTIVHSLLGIVIGLLMVFRTNTAYERWREGRRYFDTTINAPVFWDGSAWQSGGGGGGVTDHGALTGLADDDHTQYHNDTRGDARYLQLSGVSEAVDDRVAALLVAGTNIALTYDDGAGTLTIDASGGGASPVISWVI